MKRTTQFVVSPVDATPDCPVLFVTIEPDEYNTETFLSLARIDDIERLKREVREKTLMEALPFLRVLAKASISMLDEDDVIIKVSPGRAAWVISRCQAFIRQLDAEGERHGG